MTTTVTLTTHAWPVEITTTDTYEGQEPAETKETVEPNGHPSYGVDGQPTGPRTGYGV